MQLRHTFAVSLAVSVGCASGSTSGDPEATAGNPAEEAPTTTAAAIDQDTVAELAANRQALEQWGHRRHRDAGQAADAGKSPVDSGHSSDSGKIAVDSGHAADTGKSPVEAGEARDAGHGGDSGSVTEVAGLHASGGQILDEGGNAVHLHGVNHSGSEFACVGGYGIFDGPTDAASIAAMQSWNINFVRVPLNEDCWLGINGVNGAYGGGNYQAAIKAYVDLLVASGLYVSVDLHWNAPGNTLATGQEAMADSDHAPAFWTSVANTFKGSGAVMLELYNEPWPDNNQDTTAAWTCWRDGGKCAGISYPVAGMQTLVDAVRATGATNLLLLGGVEYSNALSQWAAYKPTDSRSNLAAAWHVYNGNACSDTSCFDQIEAPLLNSFPIVATEVGDDGCDGTFPTTVMQWLDSRGQGYSGWTWNAWGTGCGNYSIITNSNGTPNGTYGNAFKTHFQSL